jgi:hypothetical protein
MANICFDEVKNAIGDRLEDSEIAGIIDGIEKKLGTYKNYRRHINDQDEALRLLNELKQEANEKAILNLVNRVKKNKVVKQDLDFANTNGLDLAEMAEAKLGGKYNGKLAEGLNYDSRFNAYFKRALGGFYTDLDKLNLRKVLEEGKINRQITQELWELREGGKPGITGNKQAKDIAKVLRKYYDYSVEIQNRAGSYVNRLEGYVGRQVHDSSKLNRFGKEQWKEDILGKLDMQETFKDIEVSPEQYLDAVYDDIITGKIYQYDDPFVTRGMEGDVIQRATKKRKLIFKDADSAFDYDVKYGSGGNTAMNLYHTIQTASRNTAVLELFGPSPKAWLDDVLRYAKNEKRGDFEGSKGVQSKEDYLKGLTDVIDGTVNITSSEWAARWGANIRALNTASKLGSATISQMTDIVYAANAMSIQGGSFLKSMGDMMTNFLKGRPRAEKWKSLME